MVIVLNMLGILDLVYLY